MVPATLPAPSPALLPGSIARPLALACLSALLALSPARADDAVAEFNVTSNVAGSRWTCGTEPVLGGAFTLLPTAFTDNASRKGWKNGANDQVMKCQLPIDVNIGGVNVPQGSLTLEPKVSGSFTVVRWTAPASGAATIVARFVRLGASSTAAAQVAVLQGGARVFNRSLTREVSPVVSAAITLTVTAGDAIDFAAGTEDGSAFEDIIGLDATVHMEPAATPSGPVVRFAGERFVACKGDTAAESVAFDPINRRLASNGAIRNVCGAPFSPGPDLAPGLAWDQRTQTYWQITNARVVKQWSANGAFLGNLFTLPATFTVPGWGLDTLDTVKGIAVDSNFVYVVDAGPNGVQGQIHANEWFKFTRTGTPVKSSKLTDFHANLDLSPDAIADDILYVPFSAPFLKGKLIIPLEHSGLQVIDPDGNFVSKLRWTDPGMPPGVKLAGFAGITIDPSTGSLYLVENDGSRTEIWTRIPVPTATYYLVGTGTDSRLHMPAAGCDRPLWIGLPSDASVFFGCAYRPANQTIYGLDYNTSQLFRFFPGSGAGGRVGLTGVHSSWACAYDAERDVLYGTQGQRLFAIDPVSGVTDPRPGLIGFDLEDIAYDSIDHHVYGVSGTQLIRVDRDTGLGTVVGPTVSVGGIDYEPISNRLIGHGQVTTTLWSIDPASGAATSIGTLASSVSWEGLAVVPVPAAGTVAVEPAASMRSAFLSGSPNPSRGSVALAFDLPVAADTRVGVFDVQGRLVRDLGSGRRAAGPHHLAWDGRSDAGAPVAGGVYFARVEYGTHTLVSRIVRVP